MAHKSPKNMPESEKTPPPPVCLPAVLSKYANTKYFPCEKSLMVFITGVNGAISADMAIGCRPKAIIEVVEDFFIVGEKFTPRLSIAVKKNMWSQKWGETVENLAPEYMEEVLSGLGGGEDNLNDDDEEQMTVETSAWNVLGNGLTMVVEMVDFENDGDVVDMEDAEVEKMKKEAMMARGWKCVDETMRKRKADEISATVEGSDEDDEDEDDDEDEEYYEEYPRKVDMDPSNVDMFYIKIDIQDH